MNQMRPETVRQAFHGRYIWRAETGHEGNLHELEPIEAALDVHPTVHVKAS